MTLLSEASFLVTPNGYKEDKLYAAIPTNGNGDMTFTRATTATRVNEAGLVELVPYNLFTYSEQFDNAIWKKQSTTVTSNVSNPSPNGTLTTDKLIPDTSLNQHRIYQDNNFTGQGVLSVYAKADGYNFLSLGQGGSVVGSSIIFNLSNGTISGTESGFTPTIENIGNGWYRCSIYRATLGTGAVGGYFIIVRNANNSSNYNGDGVSGILTWGAQVVEGSSALTYQKTVDRLDIPRIDYTGGGCPSILLEPQRTNSIPNSTMAGAVLNTTTMPTGWQGNPNGLTQTIVGIGTENGLNYIDIRFNGIASISGNSGIRTTNATTIAALQNQNWTFSTYIKILAQPLPAPSYQLVIYERNSVGGFLQSTATSFNNTTLNRISHSSTLVNVSTAYVQSDIIGTVTSGQSYDFTLRIAGIQLEAGAYPTSYIPTVASTVTRNADVISKTGISDLIGQTEGVLFIETAALFNDLTQRSTSISDGTGNNRLIIYYNSPSNQIFVWGVANGVLFPSGVSYSVTDETEFAKIAVRYRANDITLWVNGYKRGTDITSQALPINFSRFGFDSGTGITNLFAKVKSAQLYKTYLSDAQMAALTTL
jgi:hypothetical protein